MSQVWDLQTESLTQKLLLLALADNANDAGVCWPSVPTICRKCQCSERTVQSHIKRMEELNWVSIQERKGHSSVYRLSIPTPAKSAPPQTAHPRSVCTVPPANGAPPPPQTAHPEPSVEPSVNPKGIGTRGFPSLDQVKAKAQFIGVPEKEAETFFHHFESAGWIDKNGHPILKWESKLATWKINHQQDRAVASQKRPPSILDLRTILEAKEYTANELKKNYCSEAAMGESWNDQAKFGQWKLLRREIRNLRDTISKSV